MKAYLQKTTAASPLVVFRIMLGLLVFISIIRFWSKGWIQALYIEPYYFFSFYGFEFVHPLGDYTYVIFIICGFSALLVALGLFYRVASIVLFLSFTYIELMDKSTYLNHYYFVSMVCFLMIFLPAHTSFSLDAFRNKHKAAGQIPCWCVDVLKGFIGLVYVFAGLAKVNSDWLLHAQPLRLWLVARNDLPVIGFLFNKTWIAFLFSWVGCIYDLTIPFLLFYRSTRLFGYGAVVVFHLLTSLLFPIGMFPYIMIGTGLLFFSADFHTKILVWLGQWFKLAIDQVLSPETYTYPNFTKPILLSIFVIFFAIQVIMPFRYLFYPDELFWAEEGYRFSWRVMLMEKAGYAQFTIKDKSGKQVIVNNTVFLTPLQEKMMSTQPDMILQYAHLLRDYYAEQGFKSPQVYVDSYVVLNGRLGKPLIDPETDLAQEKDSFYHKTWILPFCYESKGL
ncbi:HTTM domain-containing protein [Xanthocytophaga flava]|uniref:HTTM domain-containing protein n=1 Tax=Xanthocytophaga flava TaxID=3048013 RepID=UPI0028D4AEDC|nr:HTTM domain-containing protein [Xanthocytophaga flavus]MDJ1470334.1 HTTM domain-containing protein [Xanthocytophaga flavus]